MMKTMAIVIALLASISVSAKTIYLTADRMVDVDSGRSVTNPAVKTVGSIKAGAFADIIAVDDDPTINVRLVEAVPFVIENGVVKKGANLFL
jgi:imidazolonepropionase-like amidohydrolase